MFTTRRLYLRKWQDDDIVPFAAINQDPLVTEFLPGPLRFDETVDFVHRIRDHFEVYGFGRWAVSLNDTNEFIGLVGLNVPGFSAHFTPCVEVGWRLSSRHWGNGYATEAAQKAIEIGFTQFKIPEILSFTVPANTRSIQVMKNLGMTSDPSDNFCHPKIAKGDRLSDHVLYRLNGTHEKE